MFSCVLFSSLFIIDSIPHNFVKYKKKYQIQKKIVINEKKY
nr:MAG TPA: hypothetical protein [Caudoviricetes sp.]